MAEKTSVHAQMAAKVLSAVLHWDYDSTLHNGLDSD